MGRDSYCSLRRLQTPWRGGFGKVFLSEGLAIGRQVAIEVLKPKDEYLNEFATSSDEEVYRGVAGPLAANRSE